MSDEPNPFDELGLEPTASARRITDVLRERAERADPDKRERIKSLWRKLTLNDDERVRLALRAHPGQSDVEGRSADELADMVPPWLGRLEAPHIGATIEDVLIGDDESQDVPSECGPPDAFERIRNIDDQ